MSGDYSRLTDRTRKRFSALLMQQGRVHLDSDWNELVAQLARRAQLQSLDTFGPAAVPVTTKDGFFLTMIGTTDASIGAGRAYVGGLLAEAFDGETVGGLPLSYLHQPFLPSPTALSGPGLFYLDVWTREVTWLEDPDLLEVALGDIDTTTRLQTVWQVKFLGAGGGPVPDCTTDLDATFPPSAGRLSTQAVLPPSPDDPCLLPESGGFRGVENRLYRVEIHDDSNAPIPSFKWSRENASVATQVQRIDAAGSGSLITVERIGRDAVLRFSPNDWIEVQDDVRELSGQAGVMTKITSVNEADRTLTVGATLAMFNPADLTRHTRIRRWDQQTGADPSSGVIPIASAMGTWFTLEDGVQVQLSFDPAATVKKFHVADSWSFAARTADASVEILTNAPPLAILHHYAPLASLTVAGPPLSDCRLLWPPVATAGCECVCVSAASHANGSLTLQMAITNVINSGGGKVCVGPGKFVIRTPLTVANAAGLTISGTGAASQIVYNGPGAAIAITASSDVVVEMLNIDNRPEAVAVSAPAVSAVSIDFSRRVRVANCRLVARAPNNRDPVRGDGAGLLLTGLLGDCVLRDNFINATLGVASGADAVTGNGGTTYLILVRAEISGNAIAAQSDGVLLDGFTLFRGRIAVCDNTVLATDEASITIVGAELISGARFAAGDMRVAGNSVFAGNARGIVVGISDLTLEDNEVLGNFGAGDGGSVPGITMARSPLTDVIARNIVARNRILGVSGDAILVDGSYADLEVRANIIVGASGGIAMTTDALGGAFIVEGNEIGTIRAPGGPARAIRLYGVIECEVSNNTIADVNAAAAGASAAGIFLTACTIARVRGNYIQAIQAAPANANTIWAAIAVTPLFLDVDVSDNTAIQTTATVAALNIPLGWYGILIAGANTPFVAPAEFQMFPVGDVSIAVFANGAFAVAPPARLERAALRNNEVGTPGNPGSLVRVEVQDDIGFSHNRVFNGGQNTDPNGTVRLVARTAIVSSNRIGCGDASKIDLVIGPVDANAKTIATVLGNIVHRQIQLNNANLAGPWLPLNLIA